MLTFSISFVYLFIYILYIIFIYLCIYSFIYLFIYLYIYLLFSRAFPNVLLSAVEWPWPPTPITLKIYFLINNLRLDLTRFLNSCYH